MPASQLSIKETQDFYSVCLCQKRILKIDRGDRLSLKVAIITMINSGLAKQVELAKAFHLSRETISNYLKTYEKSGVAGLVDRRLRSHGIPEEIEKRVVELLIEHTTKKVDIAGIISQEFGQSIGRTKIYEIRKRHLRHIEEHLQSRDTKKRKKN